MIVDADGAILGRLASRVAKELLKGENVIIINSEKAVVSGNPDFVVKRFLEKIHRGDPHKGPFYPKYPDRLVRRVVRGMLPYKKQRGRQAFKRLRVHVSNPQNLKGEKIARTVEDLRARYMTVQDICRKMGAKYG